MEEEMASHNKNDENTKNLNDNLDDNKKETNVVEHINHKETKNDNHNVRYLGKGSSAIVRPGVVLLAPAEEYHHFYRQAAIFIFAMGENEITKDYMIRGVILDHPTPFTLAEMMNNNDNNNDKNEKEDPTSSFFLSKNNPHPLGDHFIFRGGDTGGKGVLLLHNQKPLHPNHVNSVTEIGYSGIYQGGWDEIIQTSISTSTNSDSSTASFKIFFHYCEFTEQELEQILSSGDNDSSTVDRWCSVEVDSSIILNNEYDRGECWSKLRNAVKPYLNRR
jgi:Uncharacterized ACR, COG1678